MIEATEQGSYIDRIAAFFGIGPLTWNLRVSDQRRLLYASALPALCLLIEVARFLLTEFAPGVGAYDAHNTFWYRIATFLTFSAPPLRLISLTLLLLFSVYPVSRTLASWCLGIVILLLALAGSFALLSAAPQAIFYGPNSVVPYRDWQVGILNEFAYACGFFAVAYGVFVYRGFTGPIMRRPRGIWRRTIPDLPTEPETDQPREL
jgi:hypothetical protein